MAEYTASSGAEARIYRIVLTGGPCAGKTSALARLTQRLEDRGFSVYRVPEAATLLQSGGLSFAGLRQDQVVEMQAHLMRVQAALEDEFDGIARTAARYSSRPSVLLADRGLLDGSAYVSDAMFREVVLASRVDPWLEAAVAEALPRIEAEDGATEAASGSPVRRSASADALAAAPAPAPSHGRSASTGHSSRPPGLGLGPSLLPSLTPHAGPEATTRRRLRSRLLEDPSVASAVGEAIGRMRDDRYDAVIHLVTAADGALEHYTTANNATRSETPEQAVAVDRAIRDAWLGSPSHRIIGNSPGGFEDKMDRAVAALSAKVGVPLSGAAKRFWLLRCRSIDDWVPAEGAALRDFAVVHTYLKPSSAGSWVSKAHDGDAAGALPAAEAAAAAAAGSEALPEFTDSVRLTLRRALDLAAASDGRASPAVVTDDAGIPLGGDGKPLTVVASGLNTGEITLQLRAARRRRGAIRPEVESQRMLTAREYEALMAARDPDRRAVAKRRRVLVHGPRAFEIDEVTSPAEARGLCLLSTEVELGADGAAAVVELPPGIVAAGSDRDGGIEAVEVTGDARFLTSSIASGRGPPSSEWALHE